VALEMTVTMEDEITRTLESNNPPSIVLINYTQYDILVSTEVILVVNATGSSNNNDVGAGYFTLFLMKTTHILLFRLFFLPLDPLTSYMDTYYNVIEWLIVAEDDNPPVGTTGMTTIVVMVRRTDGSVLIKKWENTLKGPHKIIINAV
jgi:hypothetical protein